MISAIRKIAFYLPQYHPVAENDRWWGLGFTDWISVVNAQPLFRGHNQPNFPADLGYYDLRVPEVREAQAALARDAGLDAFCYYHYWFDGRRVLERPFDAVRQSGRPDFPFCLCWANEPWTRSWDGRSGEVLLAQRYSEADDRSHISWLLSAFRDRRYFRVEGKPLFLVYRASSLPDPARTTDLWRDAARSDGLGELYLCRVESFPRESDRPPSALGFDAAVEFQPDWRTLELDRWRDLVRSMAAPGRLARVAKRCRIVDYAEVARRMMAKPTAEYRRFPCVLAGWDNSPRRPQGAFVLVERDPRVYGEWLANAIDRAAALGSEPLVFINAWNEWAEGAYLEPCRRFGSRFLEATAAAVGRAESVRTD